MRSTQLLVAVSAMAVLLVACGGQSEDQTVEEAAPKPTVFDPLTDSLERAASVEDTLRESAAERRRQLEEAEGH